MNLHKETILSSSENLCVAWTTERIGQSLGWKMSVVQVEGMRC